MKSSKWLAALLAASQLSSVACYSELKTTTTYQSSRLPPSISREVGKPSFRASLEASGADLVVSLAEESTCTTTSQQRYQYTETTRTEATNLGSGYAYGLLGTGLLVGIGAFAYSQTGSSSASTSSTSSALRTTSAIPFPRGGAPHATSSSESSSGDGSAGLALLAIIGGAYLIGSGVYGLGRSIYHTSQSGRVTEKTLEAELGSTKTRTESCEHKGAIDVPVSFTIFPAAGPPSTVSLGATDAEGNWKLPLKTALERAAPGWPRISFALSPKAVLEARSSSPSTRELDLRKIEGSGFREHEAHLEMLRQKGQRKAEYEAWCRSERERHERDAQDKYRACVGGTEASCRKQCVGQPAASCFSPCMAKKSCPRPAPFQCPGAPK